MNKIEALIDLANDATCTIEAFAEAFKSEEHMSDERPTIAIQYHYEPAPLSESERELVRSLKSGSYTWTQPPAACELPMTVEQVQALLDGRPVTLTPEQNEAVKAWLVNQKGE